MADWPRQKTHVIAELGSSKLVFNRFEVSIVSGPDKGSKQSFGQEVVQIGTARSNDVVVTDRTVSRFHVRIETGKSCFRLVDLGSTNGTFLGGQRIESAFLDDEGFIDVGNTQLKFRPLGDQATVELPNRERMGGLIGASPRMRQLYSLLDRIAGSELPVIIEGETGTGKELVAHIIHDEGPRAEKPFEVIDCGAIPDTLIESELFGHVKGAFTGADRERRGIFERANGGTVFLDELGELKTNLQPKLLRVLETGEIRRVGGSDAIKIDVRVVAATHRSLRDLVNRNEFREDLYYRLAGCKIDLPPLRDRTEDIPMLAENFLRALRRAGQKHAPKTLDKETLESFMGYSWPGNVRQLRNAVERLAVMGVSQLGGEKSQSTSTDTMAGADVSKMPLKDAKEIFERRYLEELMSRYNGKIRKAADAADLHPKSLARLLRRYAINRD